MGIIPIDLNATFAQDDAEKIRNFRFGLKVTPSVNWLKSEDKKIQSNGAVLRYGGGLVVEYRLAKVVSFISGIQIDVDGEKQNTLTMEPIRLFIIMTMWMKTF